MLRVFARQPVATIATRLARRLGIKPTDKSWPTDLLEITETPRAWTLKRYCVPKLLAARARHRALQTTPTPAPEPAQAEKPPYHPRE
jgi:hypothetical protein